MCRILFYCDRQTLKECRLVDKWANRQASRRLFHTPSITNLRQLNSLYKLLDHNESSKLNHAFRRLDFSKRSQIFSGRLLKHILVGSQVDSLNLNNCSQLSRDDLMMIMKNIDSVKHLKLDGCQNVCDKVISALESRNLQSISLMNCPAVTNDSLAYLSKFRKLETICISCAKGITGLGFRMSYLNNYYKRNGMKHVCKLKRLHFEACGRFEDPDLEAIGIECCYMERLTLISNSGRISPRVVETVLAACPNLAELKVHHPHKHGMDGQIFHDIPDDIDELLRKYGNVSIELA